MIFVMKQYVHRSVYSSDVTNLLCDLQQGSTLGPLLSLVYIKVARVVNLKLAFTGWFFYNLIILIKLYKIRYVNLNKALLFPRNQVICLKNLKLWRTQTTVKFNIFCWNFAHVSYLMMSIKGCLGFFCFIFFFRSWIIIKNVKNECVETRSFWFFGNNSRSKQNKKTSEGPFIVIGR